MLTRLGRHGLLAFALASMTVACSPSRPISPIQVRSTGEPHHRVFDDDQNLHLARLQAVLAQPIPADLASGLSIRLAFDEVADLDLFVTDPSQESVYFANSPTRSGGRLIDDRRCSDPAPRIEVIHFPDPIVGRYRVGVDFHGHCEQRARAGSAAVEGLYIVRVEEGGRVLERRGMLIPGQFEVIVLEFDVH